MSLDLRSNVFEVYLEIGILCWTANHHDPGSRTKDHIKLAGNGLVRGSMIFLDFHFFISAGRWEEICRRGHQQQ